MACGPGNNTNNCSACCSPVSTDMLHELLLSLSGHPSVLFDGLGNDAQHVTQLLSPPEVELLSSIRRLSRLHRETRDHVARIAASHPSTVCRAVATAITSHHLAAFQQDILQVESRILKQDASIVGAYNIVPLAAIVSEFSGWERLMTWLWDLSQSILPIASSKDTINNKPTHDPSSGAKLIDKLRVEVQTGYPDLEDAARHLSKVADAAWLRQLSPWLLHGRLPSFGTNDFFVQIDEEDNPSDSGFRIHHELLPKFVTRRTATSILFIGRSLNQIRSLPAATKAMTAASNKSELDLLPAHVDILSRVTPPVAASELSEAVSCIRLSLSSNLLQYLLPREKIIETLSILHEFFLIGRGEFATSIIAEADARTQSRHHNPLPLRTSHSVRGLMLKEGEVSQVLATTLSILSSLSGQDDHTDDILDAASRLLSLLPHDSQSNRPGTPGRAKDADALFIQPNVLSFNDTLLSMPTTLAMTIQPPLDLFITKSDLSIYSMAHSYLLAIRRAHLHLTQLWVHSSIRRDHPCPPSYTHSNSKHGKAALLRSRQRAGMRRRSMRGTWATCRAAIYFLAEIEAYFQGSIIKTTFNHFMTWATKDENGSPNELFDQAMAAPSIPLSEPGFSSIKTSTTAQQDPEVVANAHRQCLASILQGLLINDVVFTKILRAFCTHADELVAYITRLAKVQQNLDLEEDEGVGDSSENLKNEEKEIRLELDRARKRLDSDLKGLVGRLHDLDNERIVTVSSLALADTNQQQGTYTPPRLANIDQLLMKLDWGYESEEETQDLLK